MPPFSGKNWKMRLIRSATAVPSAKCSVQILPPNRSRASRTTTSKHHEILCPRSGFMTIYIHANMYVCKLYIYIYSINVYIYTSIYLSNFLSIHPSNYICFATALCSSYRTTRQQQLSVSLWRNKMVNEKMNKTGESAG